MRSLRSTSLVPAIACVLGWALALGATAQETSEQRLFEVLDLDEKRSLPYSVWLPAGFDSETAYPVLIGPGEGTPESDSGIFWGEDPSLYGWIVVESMAFLKRSPVETTAALLDHLAERFRVEGGKFHIVGWSANSAGSFKVALALPDRFHSATGIPGHPRAKAAKELARLKPTKVRFVVGQRDAEWLDEVRRVIRVLRLEGVDTKLEVVPGGGHVLEELFGAPFFERMDPLRER